MASWASAELQQVDLGDKRLNKRLIQMVDTLTRSPQASVPQAFQHWSQIKAAYRFWNCPNVSTHAILEPHRARTLERAAAHKRILAIQDTTALDFSSHRKTRGLGYLYTEAGYGMFLHSTLACTTEGLPLGLLDQRYWARPAEDFGKKRTAMQRPIQQKESYRWIEALRASAVGLPPDLEIVTVADREADFYELFATDRPAGMHLLIRSRYDRRVTGPLQRLIATVEAAEVCGEMSVEIGRGDGTPSERPPREAVLQLRHSRVELLPTRRKGASACQPGVEINAILAQEVAPPQGEQAIRWMLLTTLPLEDLEAARACVLYYSRRWLIERFHYVLKQGCRVEELQLEQADRLERAAATYSLVAWRLLWLLYVSRVQPEASCETVFKPLEWQALYTSVHHRLPPAEVPSLELVVLWLARLGGFIGRKHDGLPGVKVLWRGLRRLGDITQTWRLAQSLAPPFMGNA